jgi:hypothetical protein
METDQSIVQLGEKLDAWWGEFSALLDAEDHVAQGKMLLRGFEIAKEFDRLKAEGMSALNACLDRAGSGSDEQSVVLLVHAFELSARLADTLHNEFSDTADGETKLIHFADTLVKALNAIYPGRGQLAVLLDHLDPGVRALAGSYLIDLMPDRVVPILREVHENERGSSAGFRAYWSLVAWERERKSRFNFLGD